MALEGPSFQSSTPPLCQQQQHPSPRPSLVVEMDFSPWGNESRYHGMCHSDSQNIWIYAINYFCFMMCAWTLFLLTCPYLGGMTEFPSKSVPLGVSFHWVGSWKAIVHSHHTYHFSSPSLSSIPYIGSGIGFAKQAKGYTLPCGKKGLKAQRVKEDGKR